MVIFWTYATYIIQITYMPNFRSKGGFLQKFLKAVQATRKVQGNITFDPGTWSEKKIPLKGYMFTPCVKISWTSNQKWLLRNLPEFSIVCSTDNCPLGITTHMSRSSMLTTIVATSYLKATRKSKCYPYKR